MLYDQDSSGSITKDEMVNIFMMMYKDHERKETDEDEELEDAWKTVEREVIKKAEDLFHDLDADGDGEVTEEEFIKGCLKDEDLSKHL